MPDPTAPDDAVRGMPSQALPLIAYVASSVPPVALRVGPRTRGWMDTTRDAFAYRCLPLVMGNQLGWEALCPVTFSATWNGGPRAEDLEIVFEDDESTLIESHFGEGVLTFKTGYLFRTPPGHNLWVKGPANRPKDGIAPLEGLVEADWGPFAFTMNWRFTRADQRITFARGEPFLCIVPYPRHYVERYAPAIQPLAANPGLEAEFLEWKASRNRFLAEMEVEGSEAEQVGWQKHYMHGTTPVGERFAEHARRLSLRPFDRNQAEESP